MRRSRTGRTDAMVSSTEGEQGFWPSYADMMSAVALILFFLMLLSYIQNLITGNDLQNTQEVLEETRTKLALTTVQVQEAEEELSLITMNLEDAKLTLESQEEEIAGQLALIGNQEALLADQKAQLDKQNKLIDEQASYVVAANKELVEMRGQMQSIAVLRLSILQQIKDSISKVMGSASKVSIGENGNIILDEGVFFDTGSSAIKNESKAVLNQLIKVFSEFLADSENSKYVDSIVISGHTDDTGDDDMNLKLSTDRANSVLTYLLGPKNGKLADYSEYFCSAGYGESRPVADNKTVEGRAQNRRIEISIILKDDSVMDIVESYLALDVPDAASVTATTNSGKGRNH